MCNVIEFRNLYSEFELGHNAAEATKNICWSQYSNQMVQEISFRLQRP